MKKVILKDLSSNVHFLNRCVMTGKIIGSPSIETGLQFCQTLEFKKTSVHTRKAVIFKALIFE